MHSEKSELILFGRGREGTGLKKALPFVYSIIINYGIVIVEFKTTLCADGGVSIHIL
jgi:hypothetical protein